MEPCQTILNSTSSSLKAAKLPRNLTNSNEVGVGKNFKSKSVVHDKAEEFELSRERGKPNPMQSSHMELGGREECGVMEMDVNQVTQSAPDSPPFCDTKGSDNDCSDQDSEHVRKHTLLFMVFCLYTVKSMVGLILFQHGFSFSQTLHFSHYLLADWKILH